MDTTTEGIGAEYRAAHADAVLQIERLQTFVAALRDQIEFTLRELEKISERPGLYDATDKQRHMDEARITIGNMLLTTLAPAVGAAVGTPAEAAPPTSVH